MYVVSRDKSPSAALYWRYWKKLHDVKKGKGKTDKYTQPFFPIRAFSNINWKFLKDQMKPEKWAEEVDSMNVEQLF